jgi:glycosyltransferase involved in cell wall biosynthesis
VTPQHLVIVLPTTGEFDSRTYRIASGVVARGHRVTVMARWRVGLPEDELHPAGYRIRRIRVSARNGVPGATLAQPGLRWWRARRGSKAAAAGRPPSASARSAPTAAPVQLGDEPVAPSAPAAARGGPLGRARRAKDGAVRLASIALVIRSQMRNTHHAPEARLGDLYHGMAYMGIPVALDLGKRNGAPVVYDARDIYVDAGNLARLPRPVRALVGRWERGWARRANRVITVNRPYAEVMASRWNVELPLIVLNCSYRREPPANRPRRFHEALGLAPETRVVLYHGGFSRDRGIEQLIDAIPSVPGAVLVLLGYGKLQAELERRAADPALAGCVRLLPAVPPAELLDWVAAADVVAMPIQPSTLNHRLTTPNKLFEAMAAGVPVVASDLPGMAGIVRESGAGVLVDPTSPAAIAEALRGVLASEDRRAAMGARALAAAHETYNWERQLDLLLAEYGRLTGRPW